MLERLDFVILIDLLLQKSGQLLNGVLGEPFVGRHALAVDIDD